MDITRQIDLDQIYMNRCIALASLGLGVTSPNPLVGALVVKDNVIIGEGYHQAFGQAHAEVNALRNCRDGAEGATLYCNLEPCCHTNKKTPPCVGTIIGAKIKRVVIANLDPNPEVSGEGAQILRDAGLEVVVGILKDEGERLNEIFFKYIQNKGPFVHLKFAQTLDGKIATVLGDSKWISDEAARREVHELRFRYDAVMVGRKTVDNDNPTLTIRMGVDNRGKVPYRIVVGSIRKLNLQAHIFNDEYVSKTIIMTTVEDYQLAPDDIVNDLQNKGIRIIFAGIKKSQFNLREGFLKIGELGIASVLVEGGNTLIRTIFNEKLFDKVSIYVAPKLVGDGEKYFDQKIDYILQAQNFNKASVRTVNDQAVFEGYSH